MKADEDNGGPEEPAPDPPRRSWPRRVALALIALALVPLFVIAIGVALLHTSAGQTLVRRGLEAWGSRVIGGTLRIGQLDLRPFEGHATLSAVSVAAAGITADVHRIELDWWPGTKPRLFLLRPRVTAVTAAKPEREGAPATPATGLAAQPWLALERLGRAEVEDGRFEQRDATGTPTLVLGGLELVIPETELGTPISLKVAEVALGSAPGGGALRPASASGTFRLQGGAFVVENVRFTAGPSSLELAGRLERILPTTATARARATLDDGLVRALAPDAGLAGRIEADTEIQVTNDLTSGPLRLAAPALTVQGVGPLAARLRARFEGSELILESLAAEGFGGVVDVTGKVALASGTPTELRGRIDGIDPRALAQALTGNGVPLAARLSGTLRWTTGAGSLEAAEGEGRVELVPAKGPGLQPTGALTFRAEGRALSIDAKMEARGARLTARVGKGADGALRGRWSTEVPLASVPLLAGDLGHTVETPPLEGRLHAEGELGGTLSRPEVSARVSSHALSVRGVAVAFETEARYEPDRLSLAPLVVRAGGGQATFSGTVPLLPTEEWDLTGAFEAFELAPVLAFAGLSGEGPLGGSLQVSGPQDAPIGRASLHARATLRRPTAGPPPPEATVSVALEASSHGRSVKLERVAVEVAGGRLSADGQFEMASGAINARLSADGISLQELPLRPDWAEALAGSLSGEVRVAGTTSAPTGSLRLAVAEPRLGEAPLPPLSLEARIEGRELRLTATADRTAVFMRGRASLMDDWPARLELDLGALPLQPFLEAHPAAREARASLETGGTLLVELPLRAPEHLRYSGTNLALSGRIRELEWQMAPFTISGDREGFELEGLRLSAGRGWVAAQGRVGLLPASGLDLRLSGELDLEALEPAFPDADLGGSLELKLIVSGSRESPTLNGTMRLAGARGEVGGVPWERLDLVLRFDGGEVQVETAEAKLLGGELRASGRFPLDRKAGGPKTLAFELRDLDVARLLETDEMKSREPRSLFVSLDGELRADALSLEAVSGGGRLKRLEASTTEGTLALAGPATWSLEAGQFGLGPLRVAGPLGGFEARLDARLKEPSSFNATLTGGVDLAVLNPFLTGMSLAGPLRVDVRIGHEAKGWNLEGGMVLERARLSKDALPSVGADLAGELRLEGDRVAFETSAVAGGARLEVNGSVRLGPAQLGPVEATFVGGGDLGALDPFLRGASLSGPVRIDVRAAHEDAQWTVHGGIVVDRARLSREGFPFADTELTAEVGFDRDQVKLDATAATGEAKLRLRGGMSIGPELFGPLEANLTGGTDLSVLNPFLEGASVGGPVRVDVRVGHDGSEWRLDGGVRVESARFNLEDVQLSATDLNGELRFEGDRLVLEASGAAGDGTLRLSGGMRFGPTLLGPADLRLEVERIPIHHPPGFRARASGSLTIDGDAGRYRLGGTMSLSQAYFTGQLDMQAQALDLLAWQLAALEGGLPDQVSLNLSLRLAEPLRVRNTRMQLDVEGVVQATGTLAQPTIGGHITLRDGGEVTLGRARVRITGGRVDLNNYPARTPEVDFQGTTRVSGIAMDIRARGPLDDLQLTLSSDQAGLTQADLVTLMLTGRTATAAASQGGVLVAEQLAVALGGVLQRGVGHSLLIDVSPEHSLLTDDTDPTQRFNIGTRVTQNVTVIYSAALDGTGQRWIVEVNPGGGRFRFRVITEEDNSLSFEATDRFSFDLWNRRRRTSAPVRERERLLDLRFEGELPVPEPELRGAAGLRTGRRSSWLQREQAADRVRERLVENGYRAASVDAVSNPATGGVELVLRVDAGARVAIAWSGDDPGRRARRDGEQAWLPFSSPETAAGAAARAAVWRLQSQGYFGATVEPHVTLGEGRVDVRLHVTRGEQGNGVNLVFQGNTVLPHAVLAAGLPSPGSHAFFEMLDARSSRIGSEVRMAYAGIGHLQAQVGTVSSVLDAATRRLQVFVPVIEGAQSKVVDIDLPAEAAGADGPRLGLRVGSPFDIAAYRADREVLGSWYRARGFIDAQVRQALEPKRGGVLVRFLVDPGPQPRVGETRVAQAGRTRDALIERSLTLREGDLVKPDELAESRERLWELGIYRFVEVRAEPRPHDDTVRDLQVNLVDRPDVQVEYGLRYTTAGEGGAAGDAPSSPEGGRFQVAGAVEFSNPLGFGARTRVYGFVTRERQTWGVNLDAATLGGRRVRTQLFVFDDHDDDISISGFASRVRGVSVQQSKVLLRDRRSRRWHDRLRLQWGYAFKDIEYVQSARSATLLAGDRAYVSLGAIGDERDSLTDPRRGLFWTATTELARTGLGSDVNYVRLYGQFFGYVPLGPLVWAQGYRLGVVPGDNPQLLLENRFRAGGPTTVRGYEQNGLGALSVDGESIGGQAVAIFNQEVRFPIWKSLQGGVFWDAGNVWLTSGGLDLGDLRQSVGGGLRYIFPFGPIRVEYAWILGRKPGEPQGRFVFGLGHAF